MLGCKASGGPFQDLTHLIKLHDLRAVEGSHQQYAARPKFSEPSTQQPGEGFANRCSAAAKPLSNRFLGQAVSGAQDSISNLKGQRLINAISGT